MNDILSRISGIVDAAAGTPGFLEAVFGEHVGKARSGRMPVVVFGAGGLGREMNDTLRKHGIAAVAFCDNGPGKAGTRVDELPVISFADLRAHHRDSLVVIAALRHRDSIARQLREAGFPDAHIRCRDDTADFIYLYATVGTQALFRIHEAQCRPRTCLERFIDDQALIADAHDLLDDEKSKKLLIAKLALMASAGNFSLFGDFIRDFSEPYRDFGLTGYEGTPEDHYYFNSDVLAPENDEIYVDVGAYDGDTLLTFTEACRTRGITWRKIIAFEPDTACHDRLLRTAAAYPAVHCHPLGVWSSTCRLRFLSSGTAVHDQAAAISSNGDVDIAVTSLDDFLAGERVTLIKADPGGNIIPEVLLGARETIRRHRPKLVVGAYHGVASIYALPIQIKALWPGYRIALRHNTLHLCDTDLYAVPASTGEEKRHEHA